MHIQANDVERHCKHRKKVHDCMLTCMVIDGILKKVHSDVELCVFIRVDEVPR